MIAPDPPPPAESEAVRFDRELELLKRGNARAYAHRIPWPVKSSRPPQAKEKAPPK